MKWIPARANIIGIETIIGIVKKKLKASFDIKVNIMNDP